MRNLFVRITSLLTSSGLLFGLLAPVQPAKAYAATYNFTVNSSGDQSDASPGNGACATSTRVCTLRAAIEEADKLNQATVNITIPAMTIKLGSQLSMTLYDSANSTVNITGAGQGKTVIDGQSATRIFNFVYQPYSYMVSISSLTLQNAYNNKPNTANDQRVGLGGAIFTNANLTLTNVTFYNNIAYQGGGLYVEYGAKPGASSVPWHPIVTLVNVHFSNNKAITTTFGFGGGGIFNGSEIHGNNVTVDYNTSASQGAGIYMNSYYVMELHNFNVSNNWATTDAGGLDIDLGRIDLYDGVIENNHSGVSNTINSATGTYPGGAGLYMNGSNDASQQVYGEAYLKRVSIRGNVAEGAGAAAGGIFTRGLMTLEEVSVSGNVAAYGAGIYNGDSATTTNAITMKNTTVAGNVGRSSTSPVVDAEGAGIYNRSGGISIINSTIGYNSAVIAGGISNHMGGSVLMTNTIFTQNIGGKWGSAECYGTLMSGDYNIVGALENPTYPQFNCTMNYKAHDKRYVNPMLGAFNESQYPAYFPLRPGSPAINAGTMTNCPSVDAAGHSRPSGGACDIGAYEYSGAALNRRVYLTLIRK